MMPRFSGTDLQRLGSCPIEDLAPVFDVSFCLGTVSSKISDVLACIRQKTFRSVWRSRERYDIRNEEGEVEEQEMVSLIEPPSRFILDRGAMEPLQDHSNASREKDL